MTDPYTPPPNLRGGHRMTIFTWARPRRFPGLPPPTVRYFDVEPGTRVLAHCHWQREPWRHPTLIALHGLEGSSHAHYMRGLAHKALADGFNAVLLNQRNCGGTEHLAVGLYHSGLSGDPAAVIRELITVDRLPSLAVAGYSLGGNVALRLAGAYGDRPPAQLHAICAVSPTIDLDRCVRALERPENAIYQWNFVRNLKRRMRRKARWFPDRYPLDRLRDTRSVRTFDEHFTAPYHGFRDADDYYYRASALRVAARIRIPTLILSADDDPFVPVDQFAHPAVRGNRFIQVALTRHGGHCGFVAAAPTGYDGYWAERQALQFTRQQVDQRLYNPGYRRGGAP